MEKYYPPHIYILCMALIKKYFYLHGWDVPDKFIGTPLSIRKKVAKLKDSLLDGIKITILKNSLNRVSEKRDKYMFTMDKFIPCILYMENRLNEKLSTTYLFEGLMHRTAKVNINGYFT